MYAFVLATLGRVSYSDWNRNISAVVDGDPHCIELS